MKNYRPLPEFLTIKKSNIDGLGVFATRTILPESYIGISHVSTLQDGEEKIISKASTTDVRFYAQRSLAELSFDFHFSLYSRFAEHGSGLNEESWILPERKR